LSLMHHLHTTGESQEIDIYRDGVNLGPIRDEKAYDFNFQSYEEPRVKFIDPAKDSISVKCVYNTKKNPVEQPVQFGEMTTQEMCYATMLYWPKQAGPTNMLWFGDHVNPPAAGDAKNGVFGCGGTPYTLESILQNPQNASKWVYSDDKYDSKKWNTSIPVCNPLGNLTSSDATNLMAKLMQSSSTVEVPVDDDKGVMSSCLDSLSLLLVLCVSASGL